MNCLVTAGPTYEPLDQVRRLTNFSTGRLGVELANYLADSGHQVTLLLGEQATWPGVRRAQHIEIFTTTANLRDRLEAHAGQGVEAVFHAAAVSDFAFAGLWTRSASGELVAVQGGKIPTRHESLLAELKPTPKLIAHLRGWFPQARLTGWKYEVDGDRASVVEIAREQVEKNQTDACVANGPAYGTGFGVVVRNSPTIHAPDAGTLFNRLEHWLVGSARP